MKNLLRQVIVCLAIILIWRAVETRTSKRWEDTFASTDKAVVELTSIHRTATGVEVGRGTGFVLMHDGRPLIVTNAHVTDGGDLIQVAFADGAKASAHVLDASTERDIAVLRVDNVDLTRYVSLTRRPSQNLRIGDELMTIGCPLGESHQLSLGLYTGLQKMDENGPPSLRLSMAVDPGNSGGPLLDDRGKVIGIITAKRGGSSSIAYAVPIEQLDKLNTR